MNKHDKQWDKARSIKKFKQRRKQYGGWKQYGGSSNSSQISDFASGFASQSLPLTWGHVPR